MDVASWEVFPAELQAALQHACPTIIWRVDLYADAEARRTREFTGVAVRAQRGNIEQEIRIPASVVEATPLTDLLDEICVEAEQHLSSAR
ncbi:MAG TPA: hypothetical protein VE268_08760 [Herpetosiphonaceae bacterium]|jgi:hypothetical protein|nr:hypothetical protein [Herpetosiphonaceae bacterium]